jgi:hypothetical protein
VLPEYAPPTEVETFQNYLDYLDEFPELDHPEALGLHYNIEIKHQKSAGTRVLDLVAHLTRSSELVEDVAKGQDNIALKAEMADKISNMATYILGKLAPNFDEALVREKFPTSYEESVNSVINLEV